MRYIIYLSIQYLSIYLSLHIYMIYYKELAHVIMEAEKGAHRGAEKSQDLHLASRRPSKASSVVPVLVWKPACLTKCLGTHGRVKLTHKMSHHRRVNREGLGASLVVQWVSLCAPNAGDPGLILGQGTRSCTHAATKKSASCKEDPACHNEDLVQPK